MTTDSISSSTEPLGLPSAPRRTVPPSLVGRYEDITLIGEGGMGTVYRARDTRLGRTVALKLIKGDDPALWQRFIQEAKSQARLEHDFVCRVYEAGQVDGEPFIAMQYIDGESLAQLKNALTVEQSVKLIMEVSSAVHEAHRLGMIHRDIKPQNIMVETQEDGTRKPYIMDFGLARQVEDKGQTQTGAVVGTVAYMPPEQAKGEVRSMDRRSDVYSLGATLYDVLAGRPPFVADTPWNLLFMVGQEEAPALGKVKKGIPADLETIVMKCLERDPARRYDSAKALADDLKRFLDGDAIAARRASIGHVLWRKARKHKLLVALTCVAIFASAIPLGAWIKARRDAAAQAAFARTLGENVKEMELFLRNAYGLPNHDVEKERDVVRARLAVITQTMAAAGKPGEGPGHYAIGRGQLALGDPEKARDELERAIAAGYASPELEYALGQAIGEIYRKALSETERIQNKEEKEKKIREIEKSLRDPAMKHLLAARSAALDSPAYAEGLIAFYESKHDEALAKAKEAFEKASWLYEAKKLEGDALFAEGSKYRQDGAFDYDKMMTFFGPAAEAYRMAGDIARSDPEVHRAACEMWTQRMLAAIVKGQPPKDSFVAADAACNRATAASSKDGRARVSQAFVHTMLASYVAQGYVPGEDPVQHIQDAIRLAEEAVVASPDDAMAHYVLGGATFGDVMYAERRSLDGSSSRTRSIAAYEAALRIESRFSWALMEFTGILGSKIVYESWRGLDIETTQTRGLEIARQSIALDPRFPNAWNSLGELHRHTAQAILDRGQSPKEYVEQALRAYAEFTRLSPLIYLSYNNAAFTHLTMAEYEVLAGQNPDASLQHARNGIEKATQCGGGGSEVPNTAGRMHFVRALHGLQQGGDPTGHLNEARVALGGAAKESPWSVGIALDRTRTEILALRWAMKQQKATAAMFDAALAPLQSVFTDDIADPNVYIALAEVYALRAAWVAQSKKNPADDISKGLAMADKALVINPRNGQAHAAQGQLWLNEARAAKDDTAKKNAAKRAKEAFEQAFKENPLMERQHAEVLREAIGLL